MYIKSIVIDGFKSYGTRTEINGFDPEFNAITGLNGTGKSNILDSICFVLGISNLSHVRANSLNDLIYKSGQAGVTRASVTIVFDNSEPEKSPINYEQYEEITVTRQIVIAGKNRYMINGSTVTNKAVSDFFSSIQLNVNNPHFLIMQGRITKVLNMKPPEILSMIEEAAGTRMYENKKNDAQKTIEKKDTKLREINDMVADQIHPKMQRLKEERTMYAEYQRLVREIEVVEKQTVVAQLITTEALVKNRIQELKEARNNHDDVKLQLGKVTEEIKDAERQISDIQKLKDQELGGKLQALESELKEAEKKEAKESAIIKSAKETIANENRHLKQLQKSFDDDEKALKNKRDELSKAQATFDQLQESEKQDAEALAAAQKKFQAVSSGLLENTDGENATLQDQLMDAKQQAITAETEMKKCALKIAQDKKELESKKPLLKKTEMAFAKDKKDLEEKENELKSLRDNLSKCNYQEGQLETIQENCRILMQENRRCEDIVNNFTHRYPQLNFTYKDPEPNFDRRKVKGLLCTLFSVKEEKFARALESAAGGKLYNVVVENDMISAKLIEKGQLQKRTTFAPLNKIQGHRMDAGTLRRAQEEYGAENVYLAQSLVSYKPEYENVMSWTFGQILICPNIDVAEKICFRYKKKTITLDGDVFDPQGVISGGAVETSQPILLALIEYKKAESVWLGKKKEIEALNDQIRKLTPIASSYENMKEKAEVRAREVEMVRSRLEQTSHFQLQSELKGLQEAIDANEANILKCQLEVKEKSAKAAELEHKMKNLNAIREKEVANAEAELKKAKKKAEDSRNKWKQREQEFETLNLEIQELEKSVESGKEQILKLKESIAQLEEDLKSKSEVLAEYKEEVNQRKEAVKAQKNEINKQNSAIHKLNASKDANEKIMHEFELDVVKCGHAISRLQSEQDTFEEIISTLLKNNKWVEINKDFNELRGGRYDPGELSVEELQSKQRTMADQKQEMSKHVSLKGVDVLGNQEERFNDVMNKKDIIEEDRTKILSVIEELDVKKEEVIKRAWDKVNHDFHSILSSLLPSAQAKLKPVDGKSFMDGLEVKVGFGGLWKDSLDELSGGQRSLVALSLILAMLLFKPAPLYILDEVDAALDPSHTQNIGQMLKTHFTQSQFIVVSLKDGMFNNANVIFRTAFVDGMSTVIRTTNTGRR